ncbi:hypothetical protein QVD17_10205 [Tagetes erecta]|uniref:Uncharacterized protein n=1 Tax=Tagetes erecta TaxID=13708 RepID=A0AAD8L0M9_TARER|nr:hypothetical protein QVD17_10205 [Tagetes erecta]
MIQIIESEALLWPVRLLAIKYVMKVLEFDAAAVRSNTRIRLFHSLFQLKSISYDRTCLRGNSKLMLASFAEVLDSEQHFSKTSQHQFNIATKTSPVGMLAALPKIVLFVLRSLKDSHKDLKLAVLDYAKT